MKKLQKFFISLFLLLNFISFKSFAQAPEWEWAKSVGGLQQERGDKITSDRFGNSYVSGIFITAYITFGDSTFKNAGNSSPTSQDIFLVKYNSAGEVVWAKTFGGIDVDVSSGLITDKDGNIYLAGSFSLDTINFGSFELVNKGYTDAFITKFDTDGNVLWAKALASTLDDNCVGISLDENNNLYISGNYWTTPITIDTIILSNNGKYGPYIAKFNSDGNVVWAKSPSTNNDDGISGIACDSFGNVYLSGGYFESSFTFAGNPVTINSKGSIVILKYNSEGNEVWLKEVSSLYDVEINGIATDSDENIYLTGAFYSHTFTAGTTILTNTQDGANDIFIIKLDPNSNVLWAKSGGGVGRDRSLTITTDNYGNSYIAGEFTSKALIFGSDTIYNSLNGFQDIFIVKYDQNGELRWVKSAGGENMDFVRSISVDTNANVYITGVYYSSSITFDPFTLEKSDFNTGNTDIFIAKLNSADSLSTSMQEITEQTPIYLFPNPTASQFHITNLEPGNCTITIYTLDGQSVFKKELTEADATIDLSGKAKGAYVYRLLKDGEVLKSGAIIVE